MGLVVVVELKGKVWLDWLERVIRMDQTAMGENIVECKPEGRIRWKEYGKAQNEMAGRRRGMIYDRTAVKKTKAEGNTRRGMGVRRKRSHGSYMKVDTLSRMQTLCFP
jgi:hypothetical protein